MGGNATIHNSVLLGLKTDIIKANIQENPITYKYFIPGMEDSGSTGILPIPYGKICNISNIMYAKKIVKK